MAPISQSRIWELHPGMTVANDVFLDDGRILMVKGTVLTERRIKRLGFWDVPSVDIFLPEEIRKETNNTATLTVRHSTLLESLSNAFDNVRIFHNLPLKELGDLAQNTMDIINNDVGVIGQLNLLRKVDDYTFRHCLNVGIVAGVLGKWLGLDAPHLQEIILTGFLHDIGKTQIPLELLNKPDKLTAEEWVIMKQHPALGLKLIDSNTPVSRSVAMGIVQHHERADGTGYPLGLKGNQIATSARIIAICDVYDAMTSDRIYQTAQTPFAVIEEITSGMFDKLDPKLTHLFTDKAKESFIGSTVQLSDGCLAKVIAVNKTSASKPIVQVSQGIFINLMQRLDLKIVDLISS